MIPLGEDFFSAIIGFLQGPRLLHTTWTCFARPGRSALRLYGGRITAKRVKQREASFTRSRV
jgi:hypothetical protein